MHGQSLYKNGNEEEIQAWPLRLRAKIEHDRARCRRNFTAPGRDKDLGRDKEIEANGNALRHYPGKADVKPNSC